MHTHTSGCGRLELRMTLEQAQSLPAMGDSRAVLALALQPDIAAQLAQLDHDVLREELAGYGGWDDHELADVAQNVQRWVWLAALEIRENPDDTHDDEPATFTLPPDGQQAVEPAAYAGPHGTYIPARMMPRLLAYLQRHQETGDFLHAVLCNDLQEACGRADAENLRNLPAFVQYLYNEAPAPSWGSPAKVKAWLATAPKPADAIGQP